MDFVFHAIAVEGRGERRCRGRRRPEPVARDARAEREEQERLEAEQQEKERLAAEEKARREQEQERLRREAEAQEQERLRLEAEAVEQERLRLEAEAQEQERLRLEAEAQEQERLRLEAEEHKRQLREAEKLKRDAERAEQLKLWTAGLAAIAAELAQAVRDHIGATLWPYLTVSEQADAVQAALAVANEPIEKRQQLEQGVRQRRKKNKSAPVELQSVLDIVRANVVDSVMQAAGTWRTQAHARKTAQDDAAALAVPVTPSELTSLQAMPSGATWPVFYRALHQNKLRFHHASTYRTAHERQEKKGSQHGPFSREFYARIYGTDASKPHYYLQANWVVHVHYKSSAQPLVAEYLHLKRWEQRGATINHVINNKLEATLAAPTTQAVNLAVDQASTKM